MATLTPTLLQSQPEENKERGGIPSPAAGGRLSVEAGAEAVSSTEENAGSAFSIAQFLDSEQNKDMLRLSTAGSVDDGKSTLIGRLLYDSRNVYEDHVRSVTRTLGGTAQSSIDFAQLTDGLRAEREQGITIDVAYRYFSTERRKFIIADTPGHEQYTRNMATGASTADVAIILLDATKGLLIQSRRHIYITSLLGIHHLVAAVNKMDLVGFSPQVFARIEEQFRALVGQLGNAQVKAIPLSALDGDNVVERSRRMPWYEGPTLLEHLEEVPARHQLDGTAFRLPVQRVIRPQNDRQPNFRGFAGQIAAGTVRVGDQVVALPSGRSTRVASISTFDGDLERASAPQSIALTLEDEFDISRGDFLAAAGDPPQSGTAIEASLVWLDGIPLDDSRSYLLKHATQTVSARVTAIRYRINVQTLEQESVDQLRMNDIGLAEIETVRPIFFDPYRQNRITGSFILIDPNTNATAAAGMIRGGVAQGEGAARENASGAALLISDPALTAAAEAALLANGSAVVRTRIQEPKLWRALAEIGVIALVEIPEATGETRLATFPDKTGEPRLELLPTHEPEQTAMTAAAILESLRGKGILPAEKGGARA